MNGVMKWVPGGAILGIALLAVGACQTDSGDSGPGGGGGAQCAAGMASCGGVCTNLQADPNNCGACGTSCNGLFCSLGQCSSECAPGLTACGQSCENLQTSFQNCGACGNTCASGVCSNGVCSGVEGSGGAPGTGGGPGSGGGGGNDGPRTGDPLGFWRYGDLAGCAWTGVDETGVGSTISPNDFTMRGLDEPYCASGTVGPHPEYESVALLGFNLNDDPATADCSYDPNSAHSMGPAGIQLTGTGIAANVVKQGANTGYEFRVQIQGPNGATDDNDRWCANITGVPEGKIFVPFSDFSTKCWEEEEDAPGDIPYAREPVSAVVFLVPGSPTAVPYEFCVNGFAPGDSAEDAPDGPADIGDQQGTVGYANVSPDGDFDRAKVVVGGKEYIIQNNNWGNPDGSDLILSYFNNSFKITSGSGSSPGGGIPASFPSIYIGANGNTANGVYTTKATDNLPRQISQINSINTKFRWSGSTSSFNATYDVWFAASPPSQAYNDGIDGFVMVWVHDPPNERPIGDQQPQNVTIANRSWQVWVGPRGDGPEGYNSAKVVSFVATENHSSNEFDLLDFIKAAQPHGIGSDLYLTDVFFGFEIWNGGAGGNLAVDEFTCAVE